MAGHRARRGAHGRFAGRAVRGWSWRYRGSVDRRGSRGSCRPCQRSPEPAVAIASQVDLGCRPPTGPTDSVIIWFGLPGVRTRSLSGLPPAADLRRRAGERARWRNRPTPVGPAHRPPQRSPGPETPASSTTPLRHQQPVAHRLPRPIPLGQITPAHPGPASNNTIPLITQPPPTITQLMPAHHTRSNQTDTASFEDRL